MPFQPGNPPYAAIPGSNRCTATAKQTGRQCGQIAAPGSDKCRFHGGWSLRGRDHPAFKHGEASKANRAVMKWLTSLGVALKRLDRAKTPEEIKAAKRFAFIAMLNEPTGE